MIKHILLLGSMAIAVIGDPEPLTLEQALELARNHSAELRSARIYSQAAEHAVGVSGLWANPELSFDAEGIGLDNDEFSQAEYTLGLAQPFRLGGKRKKERAVAYQAVGISGQVLLEKELDLSTAVREAFVEVTAQQEIGKVRAEQEQLGRAFVELARRRHQAGGGSELDVVQAEMNLQELILSQTCCFGDLLAVQEQLASLIGIPVSELGEPAFPYYELTPLEEVAVDDHHPVLQRLDTEAGKVRAEALLARAQDIPDVSLGAGYRYMAEDDAATLVFFVSMPLNINRQGRAEQAVGMLHFDALQAQREATRRKLRVELAELLALYHGARAEVDVITSDLIPTAERFCDLIRADYEAGRLSWLEQIAALHNLADVRIRYIEALRDAHLARARISKFMKEGM